MAGYEKSVQNLLKEHGFTMVRRPRGSHDIWSNEEVEVSVPAKVKKRHTANAILKQAGIVKKL